MTSFAPSRLSLRRCRPAGSGAIQWAVDQQPYLQSYEAVDALWLYQTTGNVLGGGQAVPTGPSFIDASNVARVAQCAARGTR